ncbi:unnamed protein product [Amoebophrya sp. A120]|nr:unnamed protein product [Amoebophrya sp. A120]|eukprot:GSA120T00024645001.1
MSPLPTITLLRAATAVLILSVDLVWAECCFRIGYGVRMKPCCLKILDNCDEFNKQRQTLGGTIGRSPTQCPATADAAAIMIRGPHSVGVADSPTATKNLLLNEQKASASQGASEKPFFSTTSLSSLCLILAAVAAIAAIIIAFARKRSPLLTQRLLGRTEMTGAAGGEAPVE